jgi:hypothetical protein
MNDEYAVVVRQLAGVWSLVSSEFRTSSGNVIYPLGEDALGQAIFAKSGYMSGQLMRQGRPAFASGDQASSIARLVRGSIKQLAWSRYPARGRSLCAVLCDEIYRNRKRLQDLLALCLIADGYVGNTRFTGATLEVAN